MTELTLNQSVPVLVTPSLTYAVVQNTMKTSDDKLMFSSDGDLSKKWMKLGNGCTVKITEPVYFMQDSWSTHVFPVIEQ